MKRIFLIPGLALCLATFMACNDDSNGTPDNAEAKNTFDAMYPDATRTTWTRSGNYWVADFYDNGRDMEGWFDRPGKWCLTETDLTQEQLPEAVRTAFMTSEYAAWKIDDIDMIERPEMETIYVIEVEQGEMEYDLYYTADGTLIKAVPDDGDDDDNSGYIVPEDLPAAIKAFIAEKYPNARIVDVEVEKGLIEVDIVDGEVPCELLFDSEGRWLSTETEVRLADVPKVVTDALAASEYASYEIDEIDHYLTPDSEYYRFELESNDREVEIDIALDGTITVVKSSRD